MPTDQLYAPPQASPVLRDIIEHVENDLVVLSPATHHRRRRIIYIDNYGGRMVWEKIKSGDMPPHHLRGCLELVRMGYEVTLAEPLPDFYFRRKAIPHDLALLGLIRNWLGPDGILYCGHNMLYWLLPLKRLGIVKCHIVSNLFAREPLDWAKAHSAIITLTGAATEQAKKLAPKVKVKQLGWGADLSIYPQLAYNPESFFSCGIALRDFKTLSLAAARCRHPVQVVCPGEIEDVTWSPNVRAVNSGRGWNFENKRVSYSELLHNYYARSAASLLIFKNDPIEYFAPGFTEILEVLAMARPVIMTRTGALPTEIDVEKTGCGLFVPPNDPPALADAMSFIVAHPDKARAMGENGRKLAETYYNIERFSRELHAFFETL